MTTTAPRWLTETSSCYPAGVTAADIDATYRDDAEFDEDDILSEKYTEAARLLDESVIPVSQLDV